jgi:hypothetical protein
MHMWAYIRTLPTQLSWGVLPSFQIEVEAALLPNLYLGSSIISELPLEILLPFSGRIMDIHNFPSHFLCFL